MYRLLTLFVDSLPVPTMLRVWDVFLCEGPKIPFRVALGLLATNQPAILRLTDKQASCALQLVLVFGRGGVFVVLCPFSRPLVAALQSFHPLDHRRCRVYAPCNICN